MVKASRVTKSGAFDRRFKIYPTDLGDGEPLKRSKPRKPAHAPTSRSPLDVAANIQYVEQIEVARTRAYYLSEAQLQTLTHLTVKWMSQDFGSDLTNALCDLVLAIREQATDKSYVGKYPPQRPKGDK